MQNSFFLIEKLNPAFILVVMIGYHSNLGPMTITDSNATPKLTQLFLKAARELGFDERDVNGDSQIGM